MGVCLLREARKFGHVSDLPRNEGFPTEEKPIIAAPFPQILAMASEVDGKGAPFPAESKVPQNIHQKGMEEMKLQERPP